MMVNVVSVSVINTVELSDGRPLAFVVDDDEEAEARVLRCIIGGGGVYSLM